MRESKPHGFIAWLFDFYTCTIALGCIVALVLALTSRRGSVALGLGLLAFALLASAVYQLWIARSVSALSPGEMMAGRFVVNGTKVWRSPFSRTRALLFLTMLLTMIMAGNTWDGIAEGESFKTIQVIAWGVAVLVVVLCLLAAGRGHALAMMGAGVYWLGLSAASARVLAGTPVRDTMVVLFAVPAIACLVVALLYTKWRIAPRPWPDVAGDSPSQKSG